MACGDRQIRVSRTRSIFSIVSVLALFSLIFPFSGPQQAHAGQGFALSTSCESLLSRDAYVGSTDAVWSGHFNRLSQSNSKLWKRIIRQRFEYLSEYFGEDAVQLELFEDVIRRAEYGEMGAIGELEVIARAVREGKDFRFVVPSTEPGVKNPDLYVEGKLTEIKTRTGARKLGELYSMLAKADGQFAGSQLMKDKNDRGTILLELRGHAYATDKYRSFNELEIAIADRLISLQHTDEVHVYVDGELRSRMVKTNEDVILIYRTESDTNPVIFTVDQAG